MFRTLKLGLASLSLIMIGVSADAVTVTINNEDWKVTTITGSYAANSNFLQSQKWWGDSTLAGQFASAVGASLGMTIVSSTPNGPLLAGPSFAFSGDNIFVSSRRYFSNGYTGISVQGSFGTNTFAVAQQVSAVPLLGALPLLLTALGGMGLMSAARKRG